MFELPHSVWELKYLVVPYNSWYFQYFFEPGGFYEACTSKDQQEQVSSQKALITHIHMREI